MSPKLKIRKAISKRFKITGSGKVMSERSFGRHLKLSKTKARLRRLSTPKEISSSLAIKIRKALGVA